MSFLEELRSRMKTKQREWEKCREEVRKAKEKESHLRDELAALTVLVQAEQPKKSEKPTPAVPISLSSEDAVNKAEIVRAVIQEHGSTGLTPAQIRQLLEEKGISAPGNYLYAVLLRAKRTARVVERNGRYYPAEKEKAAS